MSLLPLSVPGYQEATGQKFDRLARQWKSETSHMSSVHQMSMHPAYQQIIGMGRDALPYILRDLEREPDHWFWALRAITGARPVSESVHGSIEEAVAAWIAWAKAQGYQW